MFTVFLATTGQGIARAKGSLETGWSVTTVLRDQPVQCLAQDVHHPQIVYAGTRHQGVLRSVDGGMTWQPRGLQGQNVKALAVSSVSPETLYAGTRPACLFVSHDGGKRWTELTSFRKIPSRRFWLSPVGFIGYVQAIALSPVDAQTLVVGIEVGAVVRSTDGGQTWSDHRSGALRDCHSLAFHVTSGSWVYEAGGTGGGVSVSQDAGEHWRQPKDGLDRHYGWAVAADPAQPDVWYASLSLGALKAHSDHNAQAVIVRASRATPWRALAGGLPHPLDHMPYALLTDPAAPGEVYAGLSNGEVWHGTEYGDAWQQLPLQLGSISRVLLAL
jgi:hypothetical protein